MFMPYNVPQPIIDKKEERDLENLTERYKNLLLLSHLKKQERKAWKKVRLR